jgi:endonuclease/exonuclease/phosphatase family metal-dependent hydrolase
MFAVAACSVWGQPCVGEELFLAFWNVENLFDTADDPQVELDEEFTPAGPKQWTDERLRIKIDNLSRVIRGMNDQRGPDILGVAEIENRDVLRRLARWITVQPRRYKIVHQDSPSLRGIDCGLLYDDRKLTLSSTRFHEVPIPESPTRDIVEAELTDRGGRTLFVFVNHWPSRQHTEEARIRAAQILRQRIAAILDRDPQADIVAFGDFNDGPDGRAMRETLGAAELSDETKQSPLFNLFWPLYRRGEGTYVYADKWEILDQAVVSSGLLDDRGYRVRPKTADRVFAVRDQLFHPPAPAIPRPNRSFSGNNFHASGYSDHLPIKLVIEAIPAGR